VLNVGELVKGYNDRARGYPELLPWMCLWDEQTVATVDQGLLALFEYAGIDAEGRSDAEAGVAVSAFEQAFSGFGSGTTVWTCVDRRRTNTYPQGHFSDAVAARINDAWAAQVTCQQYENSYTLAVHQRSSSGTHALFDAMDLIVKEEGRGLMQAFVRALKAQFSLKGAKALDARRMRAASQLLEERISHLESGMAALGLNRLGGARLLAELFNRACPASPRRFEMPMPVTPAFLSNLLCTDHVQRLADGLLFANTAHKHVGVVSLKGFGSDGQTRVGQLDGLTAIQGEISVCHCFRFIDREVAQKTMDDVEKYNLAKSVPFMHRLMTSLTKSAPSRFNEGRLALAQDAKAAQVELLQDSRIFGHHNLTVLCFGDTHDEMTRVRAQVMERLKGSRFNGHIERTHQLSAFTQTLPGQWAASVRWNFISYGNAADIAPIRTLWSGPTNSRHLEQELQRPCPALTSIPTDNGTPAFVDLWEIGVGHLKVIGPTRAGKSTATNFLLSQFRKYEPCRTIVIDKNFSCRIPTLLQGGLHLDLSHGERYATRMAPLSLLGEPRHHPFLVGWVIGLIEAGRHGQPCSPHEVDRVTAAIRGLAALPPGQKALWTLRSLATSVGPDLGAWLGQWIQGGANGHWFDNPPVPLTLDRHLCIECKDLFDNPVVATQAMSFLFYLIEDLLDDTPTIVSIEETWFFLAHPQFAAKIDDFLRTLGKRNGSLWIVTQTLREIVESPISHSILSNVPNSLYLPDPNIVGQCALYEKEGGLLPEEIERIATAQMKRHYYLKTPGVSRMLDLHLPPQIIACLGSGSRARETFERHYAGRAANPDWQQAYIGEMLDES
jgi:type IV secretion system protein VirB4